MSESTRPLMSKRRLFAGAGTAGALAAAAVVLPLARPGEALEAKPEPRPAPDEGGGYQLTEHVLRYYQTARV